MPTEFLGRIADLQSTAGEFEEIDGELWFVPRLSLRPGLRYSLLEDGRPVATLEVPGGTSAPVTAVGAIYPTTGVVPANLLRLYVVFTGPMSEGFANLSVRLVDEAGEPISGVLMMEPELWDPMRRRLTMLLEPGRIKRGLAPNLDAGPPLSEGQRFGLQIDSSFRDAWGRSLVEKAERWFEIGPPSRSRVDPAAWTLAPPQVQTLQPLRIAFGRPLDHALLGRCLTVDGVGGRGEVPLGEAEWLFRPDRPWHPRQYTVRISGSLEDLAGNSVRRVFDRDLALEQDRPLELDWTSLQFQVG